MGASVNAVSASIVLKKPAASDALDFPLVTIYTTHMSYTKTGNKTGRPRNPGTKRVQTPRTPTASGTRSHANLYKGAIKVNIANLARSRGFIHKTGKLTGQINALEFHRYTGIAYQDVLAMLKGSSTGVGLGIVAKLCALFNAQPGDFLTFEPNTQPTGYSLPPAIAGNGQETIEVSW